MIDMLCFRGPKDVSVFEFYKEFCMHKVKR